MKVAVLQKPLTVTIEERLVPHPGPHDVLVKVMAVGVCGSDVHYYEHGRIGARKVEKPLVQGHECAGIVVAIGSEVTRFQLGDRVAVEPGITCGKCQWCKEGRYNLCPHVAFLSSPPVDGAFAEYICHPEDLLFPIPDHLSFECATLIEPLSVGIHAVKRAGLQPGSSVLIMGMGPVGLTAIIAAKAYGARQIIVSDVEPFRLGLAEKLGATATIQAGEKNVVEEVSRLTQNLGVDMVIDTSGNARAIDSGVEAAKRGGKLVLIGFPAEDRVPVNLTLMLQREIDLYSTYRYTNTYPLGVELMASSENDVSVLLTDQYPLVQTGAALERARTNKSGSMKVIVYPHL
ncbi:NAD(P)-dependent alcohol dehydrogenase [Brevibacillus humidisoli]|uniref:NAD(P)-dependent alcohol dehydrogenase n=1 Tax=Brevibacillus humidisoli TaxID=2895522 RepID=UPI001E49FA11|nr:NAD(P)-dependent alcohol dehydrogenase [Brevibacillus humidisoli]UFJ43365.1 NAD(P)-dependent alcohol dehydrogenase [Brevibacillus humidisoli]